MEPHNLDLINTILGSDLFSKEQKTRLTTEIINDNKDGVAQIVLAALGIK